MRFTCSEAAGIFLGWAASEGLVLNQIPTPPRRPETDDLIAPISDRGKALLRQKQIQLVAYNDVRGRISVYLKRAAPVSKKMLDALPQTVDGYEVVYHQGMENAIKSIEGAPQGSPPWTVRSAAGGNRYTCGSSVSAGNQRDAGTLSCLLRTVDGSMFGFSNNHVVGSCNQAPISLPILAPGVYDVIAGGLDPFTIGHHSIALALAPGDPTVVDPKTNFDAAVFKIRDPALVSSYQGSAYDTPAEAVELLANMAIEKVGRTTGYTKGVVRDRVFGPMSINYVADAYGFRGKAYFDPVFLAIGTGGVFSENGDSGSLVTTLDADGTRRAVGIVTGGMDDSRAPGGKISMLLPFKPALERLRMTLVSNHNV